MSSTQVTHCGIPAIGKIPWGSHFCHFYSKREDLIHSLVPYFVAGLENRERCIWITAPPLPANEAVRELEKRMPDLDRLMERGQIKIRNARDWYTSESSSLKEDVLERWLREEQDALEAGYEGLRITGNVSFVERGQWSDFMAYEGAADRAFRKRRIIAFCTYKLQRSTSSDVFQVIRNHQFTLDRLGDSWEVIETADRGPGK